MLSLATDRRQYSPSQVGLEWRLQSLPLSSLVIEGWSYRMNWSRGFLIQVIAQAPQASIILLMTGTPPQSPDNPLRYSAEALAQKHGISLEEAQALIARAKVVPPPEDEPPES
ncbi:hypothetical protein [Novosphingobium sp. JCM 18896]|uniref:hypothetical protein n=1 Tax=Novosphingobium sp. JCM 18896 TaxID=2989731 RepID=UPI002223E8CF|nr:hypothetical protein [Novosphingobium sp. JCM 18896]